VRIPPSPHLEGDRHACLTGKGHRQGVPVHR
jgi:hypothetical protein